MWQESFGLQASWNLPNIPPLVPFSGSVPWWHHLASAEKTQDPFEVVASTLLRMYLIKRHKGLVKSMKCRCHIPMSAWCPASTAANRLLDPLNVTELCPITSLPWCVWWSATCSWPTFTFSLESSSDFRFPSRPQLPATMKSSATYKTLPPPLRAIRTNWQVASAVSNSGWRLPLRRQRWGLAWALVWVSDWGSWDTWRQQLSPVLHSRTGGGANEACD